MAVASVFILSLFLSLYLYNQNCLTYIQVYPTVFTYLQYTAVKQYILYSKSRLCDYVIENIIVQLEFAKSNCKA